MPISTYELISERLGPGEVKGKPLNFVAESKPYKGLDGKIRPRVNPYQLGAPSADYGDFWSDSGQVAYVPDDTVDQAGLGATKHFAYYDGCYAIAPGWDDYRGTANPDPCVRGQRAIAENGGQPIRTPIAMVRSVNTTGNGGAVLWANGLINFCFTQTGQGQTLARPFKLPPNKVPTDIALTSNNELLLVTLNDTTTNKGQVAIFMMEGKGIPVHTFVQMGLFNQASFSDLVLLGYVDLPVKGSMRISAACNGKWSGPSETNGKTLGQLSLTGSDRNNLYSGSWQKVIAENGYFVVTSRDENKLAMYDLSPLFHYIKESWLSSDASFATTTASRTAGTWPQTFEQNPGLLPVLVATQEVEKPVSVLCGHFVARFSTDKYKFWVGLEAGEVAVFDASKIMARFSWEKKGTDFNELGRTFVGANPISIAFSRRNEGSGSGLFEKDHTGDGKNGCVWIACRKAQKVVHLTSYRGNFAVLHTLEDQRMNDPVNVCTCVRGYIVLITDFNGKKLFGWRIGTITNNRHTPNLSYPPGGNEPYEIGGIMDLPGHPYLVTSENVN